MKVMVISDIHGSVKDLEAVLDKYKQENAERLIILGDLYYHGPRNPLPTEYNPKKVSEILNSMKEELIVIKGNCDAEVDEMISEFKFKTREDIEINKKRITLTHGHVYNKDVLPPACGDILMYGHLHIGFITEEYGIIVANPGSISLPKNNTPKSYIIIDEEKIELKNIDGGIIDERKI